MIGNLVPRVLSYPPHGAGGREPWDCWMIGSSKNKREIIRENAFEHKEEKPGLSTNRPSNNWALDVRSMVVRTLDGRPLVIRPLDVRSWS